MESVEAAMELHYRLGIVGTFAKNHHQSIMQINGNTRYTRDRILKFRTLIGNGSVADEAFLKGYGCLDVQIRTHFSLASPRLCVNVTVVERQENGHHVRCYETGGLWQSLKLPDSEVVPLISRFIGVPPDLMNANIDKEIRKCV